MKEKFASIGMMTASVPITWHGIDLVLRGATTIAGFLTAIFGAGIGAIGFFYGLTWWHRRMENQQEKHRADMEIKQLELMRLRSGLGLRSPLTSRDSKEPETDL